MLKRARLSGLERQTNAVRITAFLSRWLPQLADPLDVHNKFGLVGTASDVRRVNLMFYVVKLVVNEAHAVVGIGGGRT